MRVCTRGKGVPPNVDRWSYYPNGKLFLTSNPATFQQKVRGLTIFIFDPSAPASSAEWLPTEYRTACGGSSLPAKKRADGEVSNDGEPTATPGASTGTPGAPNPPGTPPRGSVLPKEDDTPALPDASLARPLPSAPDVLWLPRARTPGRGNAPNKVAEKSALDKLAEELAFAGAIANQQMNEDTNRPDGKPYGMPGGTNATGPNHPAVQATVGAALIVAAVLTGGGFEKKLVDALKKGERLAFKELAELGEEGAEKLVEKMVKAKGKDGRAYLAQAMASNGMIGPYSVMRKFTDQLGGKWQAHHILEVQMFKKFKLGKADLGPTVILSEAQHKAITAKLNDKTTRARTLQELWNAYREAYDGHPDWLAAIKGYLVKGK